MHATLLRVDPAKHIARWYQVSAQATLLYPWGIVCMWSSRRTACQRLRVIPAASREDAEALAGSIVARKVRRGYRTVA